MTEPNSFPPTAAPDPHPTRIENPFPEPPLPGAVGSAGVPGRYLLLGEIGRGGMGRCCAATTRPRSATWR